MRMKIVWLPTLIFCATLALVAAGLDLGPTIKTAQCRSMCLRHHMMDGNCRKINETDILIKDCDECWDTCEVLILLKKEDRYNICMQHSYQDCHGCKTACTFFQIRGMEEEKYEPTKLPFPEEDETVHMNDYDIAVIMRRYYREKIWGKADCYYAKQQPTMIAGSWIIIVTDDGVIKQYSWEKWRPKLQFLKGGPLYQAYITWQDWRTQIENQEDKYLSTYFVIPPRKRKPAEEMKQYKSFVVTWQQETGDGIMGNQVTDSESAQLSFPYNNKYLVRIATDDGPGSYPIIIDTGAYEKLNITIWNLNEYVNDPKIFIFVMFSSMALFCSITILYLCEKHRRKNGKENKMEEGRLTEAEKKPMTEGNLTKMQKKLMNQDMLRLWPNCSHSKVNLQVKKTNMNVNPNVKAQYASTSTQNTNVNVIQKI